MDQVCVCECFFLASAHVIIICRFSFSFRPRVPPHLHHVTGQVCTGHSDSYKHAERDGEYACLCVRSLGELSDWSLLFECVDEGQNSAFDAGGDAACD